MTSTDRKTSPISIIIPTRNEAANLVATVASARHPAVDEILVVDSGSDDGTQEIARHQGATVILSHPGRARQMNLGASLARGETLLFLHGDTRLPPNFAEQIALLLGRPGVVAGAFSLAIDLPGVALRLVEKAANLRSTLLQMPYGDQAIFIPRQRFLEAEGYPEVPILEDLLLIQRLKKSGRIAIAPLPVLTSGRRWQQFGVMKTTLLNQVIILGHLAGLSPHLLQRWYRVGQKF